MKLLRLVRSAVLLGGLLAAAPAFSQSTPVDVGSGAIDPVIRQQFVNAFFRNGFSNLVTTPPVADVRRFGPTGLIQEFNPLTGSGGRLALVKANTSTVVDEQSGVFQVLALLYANYSAVGVATAGYPTMDTAQCINAAAGTCFWQLFDKQFALFSYSTVQPSGSQNFSVKEPFFTLWRNAGGITVLGAATSAETAATSRAGSAYTVQSFQNGLTFSITSGTLSGREVVVVPPVTSAYLANGGPGGFLGLPTGPAVSVGTNRFRQTFEGGAIDYDSTGTTSIRLPVHSIGLNPGPTTLTLKLNDTFQVTAVPRALNGDVLADRPIAWSTTNGRVVSIQANGATATLRAVGGGVAAITATTEGRISPPIQVFVQTTCCEVGEGAPSAAAAQALQDAVTRNRLVLQLPGRNPVRRLGNGFVQEFATTAGVRVVLALPDRVAQAYVLSGSLLGRYEELGGATGMLGYPLSDASAGGRQSFENGTLAGAPVRLVSGALLTRWQALGLETGAAGPPVSDVSNFFTFAATSGIQQAFRSGALYSIPLAGRVHFTTGAIHARYVQLGGPEGRLGAPANDEYAVGGGRRQDFEGGYLVVAAGAAEATVVETPRAPTVSANPGTVIAGSRVRLALGGFGENRRIRVRTTGEQDFFVQPANGAYAWELLVRSNATPRTITVVAEDTEQSVSAQASFTIRATVDARPRLTKIGGDGQAGAPGSLLPVPLRVQLVDESNNPLAGVAVVFTASPGGAIVRASAVTDNSGEAEAVLRLPAREGIALVTAEALLQVVTFQVRMTGGTLSSFPRVSDAGDPYLASAAAILRYLQDRGEVTSPSAAPNPAALAAYLRGFCAFDGAGAQICDGVLENGTPNLWRLAGFMGGKLEVVALPATEAVLRDAVAAGPVLVSLALENGSAHAVVATSIGPNGEVLIMDPSPAFGRRSLEEYLVGFSAGNITYTGNITYKGRITGLLRLEPRVPANPGFLVVSTEAAPEVAGPGGVCGATFIVERNGTANRFRYCDGAQSVYQLDLTAPGRFTATVTDLAAVGARYPLAGEQMASFRVSRPAVPWEVAPLAASFGTMTVLNGAGFTPDLAPGALVSVFGIGLGRPGSPTTAEIGGRPAEVLFSSAFQVNLAIPLDLPAGRYPLRLQTPFGAAEAEVELRELAPAIFRLGEGQMAVVNVGGGLNSPALPAARGTALIVYGTGFGAVEPLGNLTRTVRPVSARINGLEVPVGYSGLAPGYIGLYQLNLVLPMDMPPGLFQRLELRQGGVVLLPLTVSIQ
jgi:uncharacterized protein (TIGR03437 family)